MLMALPPMGVGLRGNVAMMAQEEEEWEEDDDRVAEPVAITDEVEDRWQQLGASSELLQHMHQEESTAVRARTRASLPRHVRGAALGAISQMLQVLTQCQSGWFKAALLLDCYCSKSADPIADLPMTCICLTRIVHKFDRNTEQAGRHHLENTLAEKVWHCAENFKVWLATSGYEVAEMTGDTINRHEREIVKALEWRVDVPCVERWCTLYLVRFGTLISPELASNLQRLHAKLLVLARAVVMHQPASEDLTHGRLALGLLCVALVDAGMVPLHAFQPTGTSLTDWITMFATLQPAGAVPACTLSAAEWSKILETLKVSAQEEAKCLRVSAHRVLEVLGPTLASIYQVRMHQRGN
eukprot:gb/GFBE01019310.1/.p1 GENE.gb/GFBE01019310.1/~~gb/GFBE01019310.1/.p1  ORF type:complete len:355 (+),score=50.67 gb/GFBE01019310.1/:1-1065(+)